MKIEKPLPLKPWQARLVQYGAPLSIFRNNDIRTLAWKPWSLHPPFLGFLASLSIGFLVCIELLRQKSSRDGGLAFYSTSDDIPASVFIAYNYAPTILATLFSILWSIVDLDAKRMEPYTQISDLRHRPFPLSVLFIDYAFEPAWEVPFRACRRCHWTIAVTSTVFLVISIFLAPMQSALFGLTSVNKSHDVAVTAWPNLPSIKDQSQVFTGEAVNQANSVILHNANLPAFTTADYAISPLGGLISQGGNDETWKFQARVYWSSPECIDVPDFHLAPEPNAGTADQGANMTILEWSTWNITIPTAATNLTSCKLRNWSTNVVAPQMGSGSSAMWNKIRTDPALLPDGTGAWDASGCITFPFMAGLCSLEPSLQNASDASSISYNAVAIAAICKVDYNSALANVSLSANGSVSKVDVSSEVQKMTLSKDLLDIDNLEDSISNAYHGEQQSYSADPLHTFFGVNPVTMASVIKASLPDSNSLDRTTFKDSVARAYKSIFALSVNKVLLSDNMSGLSNETISPSTAMATNTGTYVTLAMSKGFAITSEVLLGCTAVAALCNLITYHWRGSLLRHDPDSLAAMLAFVNAYLSRRKIRKPWGVGVETASTSQLMDAVESFVCEPSIKATRLSFEIRRIPGRQRKKIRKPSSERSHHQSLWGLALFYGSLLLVTVGCALLLGIAYQRHFTYLANSNSLASQALWQFTPTLAATIIGALWTLVHRDLSLLEPWNELSLGASAATSLSVNYASRTPYVVLFKAIKRRHFLLSFISLICASTSVLNIAMGGLFSQSSSIVRGSMDTFDIYRTSTLPTSETWNGTNWPMADAFELVRTTISDNTSAPAWSTQDLFFLPRQFNTVNSGSSPAKYNVMTIGIGTSLECRYVGSTDGQSNLAFGWNVTGPDLSDFDLDFPAHLEQDPNAPLGLGSITGPMMVPADECYVDYGAQELGPTRPATVFQGKGSTTDNGTACEPYLPVLWRTSESSHSNQTLYGILCWPKIKMYNASVVLDANNLVQDYELFATLDNSTSPFSNTPQHLLGFDNNFQLADAIGDSTGYHGQAIDPYDWPGLLTARIQNISHPDGSQNANDLTAAANRTFAQTFASFWALYSDNFLVKASEPTRSTGTASYQIARMIPSIPAFAVTFALLALYIIALVLICLQRRKQITPRVPKSLGTILPWIVRSRILKDFAGTTHLSSELREDYLDSLGKQYKFGWFKDERGVIRLGLEESRYVFKAWKPGEQLQPHESQMPLMGSRGS